MGKSLGRRHRRRRLQELEVPSEAAYLKVLGELGPLSFDPELRTAAQLAGVSPVEPPGTLIQAAPRPRGGGRSAPPTAADHASRHVRLLGSLRDRPDSDG